MSKLPYVVLMLIHTHEPPPPEPEPEPRPRRNRHVSVPRPVLFLVAGLVLALLSGVLPPIPAYVLLLAACVFIGRGLGTVVRSTPGLKDYRQ